MAWVQIAPGVYINQNLTGAAGGAGQAAANNFAAQQRAAAQRAAQIQAQQNAAAAQASARASRDRLRRVGRADSAARRSLQILGQNTADQTTGQSQETSARKKKPRTAAGLRIASIPSGPSTGLNISA